MSERQYFSLRYAVPGYTLILVVIGINYVPLLRLLKITGLNSAFGSFLAFLSLFAGSALGLLISQVWWWKYNKGGGLFGMDETREQLNMLIEKKGLKQPECDLQRKKVLVAYDYVIRSKKNKEFDLYATRRWDMYHLLSSTYYTLGIGSVTGMLCRIYYEYALFGAGHTSIQELLSNGLNNGELIALILVFVGILFLLFFLRRGRQNIVTEYAVIMGMRINNSEVTSQDLRKVLPDAMRDQDHNEQSGYIS